MNKRKIVTNGMIALAIMLFVAMYYTGKTIEKEKATEEVAEQESGYSFSEEVAHNQEEIGTDEEGRDYMHTYESLSDSEVEQNIRPLEDAPEFERTYAASDFYTETEIAQALQIAKSFVTEYYAYNGDDMIAHIKRSKPYVSEEFYTYLLSRTGRATNSSYKAILKEIEVVEAYDQVEDYLVFTASVNGEVYDVEGSLFEEQSYEYYLQVQQIINEFKVINMKAQKVK